MFGAGGWLVVAGLVLKINIQEPFDVPDLIAPLIMVVDDEVLIRFVAADILRDAGFQVVEACSADEAMTLLATGVPYDLIFSDVNMPGSVEGIGLVSYVKQRYPFVSVVLTSGGVGMNELSQSRCRCNYPKALFRNGSDNDDQ